MISATIEDDARIHTRIKAEYHEMPGLCLTLAQAARLFDLELTRCARARHARHRRRALD